MYEESFETGFLNLAPTSPMFTTMLQFNRCRALLLPLLLLALVSVNSHANQTQQLGHSCGDIPTATIGFPFGFKGDSDGCEEQIFTLYCEDNRTVTNLFAGKYWVRSINYSDHTIRLVDVGILSDDCSSFPLRPLTPLNFSAGSDPYRLGAVSSVGFVSCENPVKSPIYINRTAYCDDSWKGYSYILVGDVRVQSLAESCAVEMTAISSSPALLSRGESKNLSFLDVQKALAYGFEVSWELRQCKDCRRRAACLGDVLNIAACSDVCSFYMPLLLIKLWRNIRSSNYLLLIIIGAIFLARTLFAPCAFGFLIYKFRRRHLSMFDSIEGFLQNQNNLMPIRYTYSDIKTMTKGFKEKLGEGGYGSVYKGRLRSGYLVAVKMLSKPKADGQEFINEVATIGRIHHTNVVRLIGYCAERSNRALLYDFMPNGSLEKYIFSEVGNFSLSCGKIYEISLGVARGIEYLHRGCDMQILHFDIKPHNILLDEKFMPKVSDFGLAKLYPTDYSIVTLTAARGTLGYMAPELFYKNIGGVSYKADVYSFGMLLMEMAGRRRNWNSLAESSQIYFPSWVYDQLTDGRQVEIGEAKDEEREMVKKMMVVALWCIQMKPSDRPSMNKVVEMLEGNTENLQMPPRPFLYPQETNPMSLSKNLSGACLDSITLDVSAR